MIDALDDRSPRKHDTLTDVRPIPRWRIVAAAAVLAALAFFAILFAPIYVRNMHLQSFVTTLPQRAANQPPSDDQVRSWVLEKARQLDLPVEAGDVRISRAPGSGSIESISVHYMVRVDLPGYTVNLHFYPGAGSR